MVGMSLLAVLCVLAATGVAHAATGEPLAVAGFHEGTQRTVECLHGRLSGFDVYLYGDGYVYAEDYISALRWHCSSGEIMMQYTGKLNDAEVIGTVTPKVQTVKCEGDQVLVGMSWRLSKFKPNEIGERRLSGLAIVCRDPASQSSVTKRVDVDEQAKHPQSFACSDHAPYKTMAAPYLSKMIMWWSAKALAGFEPLECSGSST